MGEQLLIFVERDWMDGVVAEVDCSADEDEDGGCERYPQYIIRQSHHGYGGYTPMFATTCVYVANTMTGGRIISRVE